MLSAQMVVLNVTLNLILVWPLQEGGLALATSICSTFQVYRLCRRIRPLLPAVNWRHIAGGFGQTAVASVVMGVVVWLMVRPDILGGRDHLLQLAAAVPVGVLVFAAVAYAIRCPELQQLLSRSRRVPAEAK
jgi:putative peptidoglycan lipid II flippase